MGINLSASTQGGEPREGGHEFPGVGRCIVWV